MSYIFHYSQYYVRDTTTFDDLQEALHHASAGFEYNELWPTMITDDAGNVIYDQEALLAECHRLGWEAIGGMDG